MIKTINLTVSEGYSFLAEIDTNTIVLAETPVPATNQPTLPSGMKQVGASTRLEREFAEVKKLIIACSKGLLDSIAEIPQPKKVCVEFGVKLGGETGFPMIAKVAGEGSFKVVIEWENPRLDDKTRGGQ